MAETGMVHCAVHGLQPRAHVCQHIIAGNRSRERVGFFWTATQPGNERPDAWCRECEERLRATRGQWIGQAQKHVQAKVLCGPCYDGAKQFHMGGDIES
jgi:hypothetical protein